MKPDCETFDKSWRAEPRAGNGGKDCPQCGQGKETRGWALLLIFVFVLALVFWPKPSQADERDWLSITVGSYHRDRDRGYNEVNYGVGIERAMPWDKWRFSGGVYKNSYYRTTWYAFGMRELWASGNWKFSLAVGAATGYTQGRADPVVTPTVSWEGKQFGINLLPLATEVVGLQIKMRF